MLQFIILLGIVSLLGDTIYEGVRSIIGPYFASLGVNALTLGLIIGLAEFLSYSVRLLAGYAADKTRSYWSMTFFGYGLIISLPLLALTSDWKIAVILLLLERLGKGIRSPPRDAILSFATKKIGRGFGFGIHEALDQIGAFLGPLLVFLILHFGYNYNVCFAILFFPYIPMLIALAIARSKLPTPQKLEEVTNDTPLTKTFWIFVTFIFTSVAGFINFQIISYLFKVNNLISVELIPILYAVAMCIDAISALIIGRIYDKIRFKSLTLLPLTNMLIPLAFLNPIAIAFYGIAMGIQESVVKAAMADLVGVKKRSTAYGILNFIYGLAWLFGSTIVGYLCDISFKYLYMYVVTMEIISLCFLMIILKTRT
ncbi:MAG TPA: MFS transporter [Archaeoglobus profundus]|nr:MFS transporter [Archaeoglobus profundus]